ncbi:hypothetical protein A0H76_1338 [Hepatospora eriocheir]|uniref:Uncharacterized protein n=1 Tax=Hepatospora eriocheir TaxID=1081669 RepID=A0A1X0Q5W4_9MICR|nr:hypothetical protein A0H76_1338 [Hepatospora eriocheir]
MSSVNLDTCTIILSYSANCLGFINVLRQKFVMSNELGTLDIFLVPTISVLVRSMSLISSIVFSSSSLIIK